jgi:linoleoyl-CoA desaturase
LPDKYLRDTADDAPETRSERMFTELEPTQRGGLKSAIAAVRARRREKRLQNGRELAA